MPLKTSQYGKFKEINLDIPTSIKSLVSLCQAAGDGCFIAGGAVRSIYEKQTPRDVDIFSYNTDAFNSMKILLAGFEGVVPEFENPMLARFKKYTEAKIFEYSIDLVVPRVAEYLLTVGTPESVIAHFDFSISRAAILSHKKALVDADFKEDCKNKRLTIKHIVCPLSTVQRIGKYAKKGYTIGTKEVLKLFIEYQRRDTTIMEELFGKENLTQEEIGQLMTMVYID
jgi:hypothetical protein